MLVNYFAYGSNMLPERLRRRCASARKIGVAALPGYDLVFCKTGKDGSGKAGIIPCAEPGARIFGIVFQMTGSDLAILDGIEGRGRGYHRNDDLRVCTFADEKSLIVSSYVADDKYLNPDIRPFDWYLDLVVKGAELNGLPEVYRQRIAATPVSPDLDVERDARREAHHVLAAIKAKTVARPCAADGPTNE